MTASMFITGVSSGIGHALARFYLQQGFQVFGLSRREPGDLIEQRGFHFRAADLANFDEIAPALSELLAGTKSLDLVVLNAGVFGRAGDMAQVPLTEMQRVMNVNLWANKLLLDALFKSEIAIRQVIAISSGAAAWPQRGWNVYSISKAALNTMIALYAAERPETHFCALAPGIVDTPMQAQVSGGNSDLRFPSFDMLREARDNGMMPQPDEAAELLSIAFERAVKTESGSFVDLSTLLQRSG